MCFWKKLNTFPLGEKKNLYSLPFLKLESLLRTSSLQLISSHALSIVDCIS